MAQSSLYRFGSSTAQTVSVTSDDSRDLGDVDVKSLQDNDMNVTNDSTRQLGQVWVQSGDVDATITDQDGPLDVSADALTVVTDEGVPLEITESDTLSVTMTDRSGRNLGKLRLMDSDEVLIDPATEATLADVLAHVSSLSTQGESGTGVMADQYTVTAADTLESLPANAVPDGKAVAVQALPGNGNPVYVGGDSDSGYPLAAGQVVTYNVSDTSDIEVAASSTSDGVAWTVEVA